MLEALASDMRCALDPTTFASERLGFEPDPWQIAVLRLFKDDTLLNCSRQAGKSTITAIIALHTALYQPGSLTLLGSPSLRQSGELFGKVTDFLGCLDTPPELVEDNKTSFQLINGSRVVSLPGTGDTVRGYSAPALVVEDEAAYVEDSFYTAIRPMLATSGGRLILMSTPHGQRGHFHKAWTSGGDWRRVEVPATECPRISEEYLERERREYGEDYVRQEYLCQFLDVHDAVFRQRDIDRMLDESVEPLFPGEVGAPDVKPLFEDVA